jgi:hypothetical protein
MAEFPTFIVSKSFDLYMKPSYTSNEMIQFVAHFDVSKIFEIKKNKFEVSKIYMTACMCIYKFCQIKEYLFMIFFCFIQKHEGYLYDAS